MFKNRLVKLRVPLAKQQLAGRKEATRGEASVSGFDGKKKDILFKIEGEEYWVRSFIQEFNALVEGIKREDILMYYNDFQVGKNGRTQCAPVGRLRRRWAWSFQCPFSLDIQIAEGRVLAVQRLLESKNLLVL